MSEAANGLFLGTTKDRLDPDAVENGAWRTWPGPRRAGLEVRIRPAATFNPHFRRALRTWIERTSETDGDVATHRRDPEFVADALVADIRGITRADGSGVAYTPEIGRAVLSDPGNADVLDWIANEALAFGDFYAAQVEEDEKNS